MSEFEDMPVLEKGLYQHYKGGLYKVLGVGRHTESADYFVVYTPVEPKKDHPEFWLRPYAMFVETVEIEGETRSRFAKLPD